MADLLRVLVHGTRRSVVLPLRALAESNKALQKRIVRLYALFVVASGTIVFGAPHTFFDCLQDDGVRAYACVRMSVL